VGALFLHLAFQGDGQSAPFPPVNYASGGNNHMSVGRASERKFTRGVRRSIPGPLASGAFIETGISWKLVFLVYIVIRIKIKQPPRQDSEVN